MKEEADMPSSEADQAQFVRESALYKEFLAERAEILKHKWIESEKAGKDIGFERALLDWIVKHRSNWRERRRKEARTEHAASQFFVPLRRSGEVAKETVKPKQNSAAGVRIMDAEAIRRALRRIAHEIIEGNPKLESVVLAGIPSRGVEIARRLAALIREIEKADVDSGVIDVAMHRDDVGTRKELPVVHASKLPVPLEDRTVIIVDDGLSYVSN